MSSMKKMNPSILLVEYGCRELKELKVYPLSIADQLTMGDLITGVLKKFFHIDEQGAGKDEAQGENVDPASLSVDPIVSPESMKDIEFISFIIELIKSNLKKVIMISTDFSTDDMVEELLSDMTNDQAIVLATKIYEMNFEGPVKNAVSLFRKVVVAKEAIQMPSPLKRPSQPSSSTIQDTDSNISSDSPSKTEG